MRKIEIEQKLAERLTPTFRETFEEAMPKWVKTLLSYYEEGFAQGVDIMALSNYMPVGDQGPLYEKDGIGYFLHEEGPVRMLTFNSEYKYIKCNWEDYLTDAYSHFHDCSRESLDNFFAYNWYMSRLWNSKSEYNCIAKQCDDYFKELTGNPDAGLSLSSTSMIYYTPKGEWHINKWYKLQ